MSKNDLEVRLKKIEEQKEKNNRIKEKIIGGTGICLLGTLVLTLSYIIGWANHEYDKLEDYVYRKYTQSIDVDGKQGISFEEQVNAYKVLKKYENYKFIEGQGFPQLDIWEYDAIIEEYKKCKK